MGERNLALVNKIYSIPFLDILHYYGLKGEVRGDKIILLCPFHEETRPSFFVYLSNNDAFCFGCSKSYDGIQFVMEKDRLGFHEALRRLTEIGHIEVSDLELRAFSKESKSFWKRYGGDEEQKKRLEVLEMEHIMVDLSVRFSRFYQGLPCWKVFFHYIEYCWELFDGISVGRNIITRDKIDAYKDWFKKSKQFIVYISKDWGKYSGFVRESWLERIDDESGRF